MTLREHAERELKLAQVDDDIYGDMTSKAVLELIDTFAAQGHSGMSAMLVLDLFQRLANLQNLTPLTTATDEWNYVGDTLWQNARNGEAFSRDRGVTYRLLSETTYVGEAEGRERVDGPLHESKKVEA